MTHLAAKLKDTTQKFKNNEKQHYVKLKDLHGDDPFDQKKKHLDDEYFETKL